MGNENMISGILFSYYETGMEEVQAVFQDERFINPKTGQYAFEGLYQICEGMHLLCWDADRHIVFDGIIKFGFWGGPKLPNGWEQWFNKNFKACLSWSEKSSCTHKNRYLIIK